MPIRINLLAEAQALEDLRRRDPVKRALWLGLLLVLLVLVWSSSLQLKAMIARGELNRVEGLLASRTNEYRAALANQQKLAEVSHKLEGLHQLASNRLLHGSIMNALQQTTVDDVQLTRLRVEQALILNEEVKGKTNSDRKVTAAKPATVTERVVLTLEAKDSGANPGDQVNKYKQAVTNCPYFQAIVGKTNEVRLVNLSPPQMGADNKPFVLFTLEYRYPEKTR
jgi:hypothetical protein